MVGLILDIKCRSKRKGVKQMTNKNNLNLTEIIKEIHDGVAREMYCKGVDDFVQKVELKYLGVNPDELYEKYYPREICEQIKGIAEQLKEKYNE